ncbi:plasmid recombination protein [Salinibacterium sp. SWN139]|uniref:plasmid recombination protein n=1 Tax=Salinibacterium sp. SWN139 TaxID=2792055 RepID=UPI0018CC935F|nr:plasmid recombination protein [Salinibacterium sp. SWN139]MBH0053180.1 plasmid recombination protein [Salinibacterium sp. SWN139]
MTFDASHKVVSGGGHLQSFLRHIARDADGAAGFQFPHSNKNIVPTRTAMNETLVNDENGGFRPLVSIDGNPPSKELETYLNTRLATVNRPLRKDAIKMRGIILQLDPKWFEDNNPDWRENGLNQDAVSLLESSFDWSAEEFGQANIVGVSVHLDEYSPQLQVLMTPVTSDGRLSQKDFFKGPSDFKRQHKELREQMEAVGYDVEKRSTERSTEHLSSSEYQAKADRLQAAAEDIESEKATYATLLKSLANRKSDVDAKILEFAEREAELEEQRRKVADKNAALDAERQAARRAAAAADAARTKTEQLNASYEREVHRLEETPSDINRWLDNAKLGGVRARRLFDDFTAKRQAARLHALSSINGGPSSSNTPPESSASFGPY